MAGFVELRCRCQPHSHSQPLLTSSCYFDVVVVDDVWDFFWLRSPSACVVVGETEREMAEGTAATVVATVAVVVVALVKCGLKRHTHTHTLDETIP